MIKESKIKNLKELKENMLTMSDVELNKCVSIKNTDYNKNTRYSNNVKKQWRALYNATGLGRMTISEIAYTYGASYQTVKMAVDKAYRDKVNKARVTYNKNYTSTHDVKTPSGYVKDLASRKRDIISSELLSHLKCV